MTELTKDLSLAQAHSLIDSYDFDLGGENASELLQSWQEKFSSSWIRLATIEALYRGRYKAVSVRQILNVWLRLGAPQTHFTYEFERLICRKLPKHLSDLPQMDENNSKSVEISFEPFEYPEPANHLAHFTQPDQSNIQTAKSLDNDTLILNKAFPRTSSSETNIPFITALGLSYRADWSDFDISNKIIHQFIPLPDVSSFFNKLKTFGEERLEGQ